MASEASGDPLQKVVRIGQLLDLYGGLLTERQRTCIRLHYEDDLSFGEIAETQGVSRQAIHDAARQAENALERYEEKLGLLKRGFGRAESGRLPLRPDEAAGAEASAVDLEPSPAPGLQASGNPELSGYGLGERLRALEERIRKSGGVIYNGEGLAREIGEIAAAIEALDQE